MVVKLHYCYRYRNETGKLINRENTEYFVVDEKIKSVDFYDFAEAHVKEKYPTLEVFIPFCLSKIPAIHVPQKS